MVAHKRREHQRAIFLTAQVAQKQQVQLLRYGLVALEAARAEGGFDVGIAAGVGHDHVVHRMVVGAQRCLQQFIQRVVGALGLRAAALFYV